MYDLEQIPYRLFAKTYQLSSNHQTVRYHIPYYMQLSILRTNASCYRQTWLSNEQDTHTAAFYAILFKIHSIIRINKTQ